MTTPVYLEVGTKKVFACAVDWPGWCRPAKTEDEALEALAVYVPRYAVVAKQAKLTLPKSAANAFDVVERIKGNATTDFGAPGVIPKLAKFTSAKVAIAFLNKAVQPKGGREIDHALAQLNKLGYAKGS